MIKFRTMIAAAEEKLAELEDLNEMGVRFLKLRRSRITRVGSFEKLELDDCQLINVLKGDMAWWSRLCAARL